jgi:hypothetical protein
MAKGGGPYALRPTSVSYFGGTTGTYCGNT